MSVNFHIIVEPEHGVFVTYVPALDESGTKRAELADPCVDPVSFGARSRP
jgi:hypothetical protein